MVVRVSHPNTPTKLIDLGPAHGERHQWDAMRRTIDDEPRRLPAATFAGRERTTNHLIEHR